MSSVAAGREVGRFGCLVRNTLLRKETRMSANRITIGKTDMVQEGDVRRVSLDGLEILVGRFGGTYYATGADCPHYGAPLEDGAIHHDRCVCPWHHAAFTLTDGKLEDPPAFDGLPTYRIDVDGDNLVVELPERSPVATSSPGGADPDVDRRVFAVVGAGAAGAAAAETLRQCGFKGRIVLVTREDQLPYDRTLLSKAYMASEDTKGWIPLRRRDFYENADVEVLTGRCVSRIDTRDHGIHLAGGWTLNYDKLLLAMGSVPKTLDVPGADLDNVMTLRTLADCRRILKAVGNARRAVIVGASFIGMECAASLRQRDLDVTVAAPEKIPFEPLLGRALGEKLHDLHTSNGVAFRLGHTVSRFEGNGSVQAAVLDDGTRLEADLVIVGIGVRPATDILQDIACNSDGGINVTASMQVEGGDGDVYAAGDIACMPDKRTGGAFRFEHWRTAQQQGRVAAANMAGRSTAYNGVPFFWTGQFGMKLRYSGHAPEWDEIIVHGDLQNARFLAYFVVDNCVRAVVGSGRDAEQAAVEECLRLDRMPSMERIRTDSVDWLSYVRELQI